MSEPYFKPWIGEKYSTTKLLILSESAYSWRGDGGKVVTPSPSHPKTSLLWWIEHFGKRGYFTSMSRALCGSATPTPREIKQAWNEYAFTIFVQGSVGLGAGRRPSPKQFEDAGPRFLALIEKIRPLKVIVTGKTLWNNMPRTSVKRRALGAYTLSDGTLVWCLALPHPANRQVGFDWEKVSQSVRRFRSDAFPLRNSTPSILRD
jgi:hypothetical protein